MGNKRQTIVVSDIHGCLDEFDELLKTISYKNENTRLICLGDLIDRGPDSLGVVRRVRELDLESVMGNHEHKFLKWYNSSGSRTDVYDKHKHYTEFNDQDIQYIFQMSNYIKIDNTVIVHAGLKSGVSLSAQKKDDLFYLRYTDLNGNFISLKKIFKVGKEAAGAHFWTEFWRGPESVIYGHNVHSLSEPLFEEVGPGVFCHGIDTGCCFGGHLTAFVLETKEIIQVPAKQTYYKLGFTA